MARTNVFILSPVSSIKRSCSRFLLFVYVFLCSCSTFQDKTKAEKFLSELLFQEGGCYTLLGDKPVTSMLVYGGDRDCSYLENLSPQALQTLTYVDSNTSENLQAWKTISKNMKFQRYFFAELPVLGDPTASFLYFVNIQEVKKIVDRHMSRIQACTGILTWEKLERELKKPNPKIWRNLFADHFLAGVLYGFGSDNSQDFIDRESPGTISEEFILTATKEHFPIPIFVTFGDDSIVQKYKKQRIEIQERFKHRNVLELSLEIMQEK